MHILLYTSKTYFTYYTATRLGMCPIHKILSEFTHIASKQLLPVKRRYATSTCICCTSLSYILLDLPFKVLLNLHILQNTCLIIQNASLYFEKRKNIPYILKYSTLKHTAKLLCRGRPCSCAYKYVIAPNFSHML